MARARKQFTRQPADFVAAARVPVRPSQGNAAEAEGRARLAAAALHARSGSLTSRQVLRLQAALGNRAVRRSLPAIRAARPGRVQRALADITLDAVDLARKVVALVADRRADAAQLADVKRLADEVRANLDEDEDARRLAIGVSGLSFAHLPTQGPRLAQLARQIIEGYYRHQAETFEQRDQGHSLARHGPAVTDPKLKGRLETGYAPDRVYSPAPGLSTRFASYEAWIKTRQAAVQVLRDAIVQTRRRLAPSVRAYFAAKNQYDATPPGPAKAPGQPLFQAVAAAKQQVQAMVEVLNLEEPGLDHIPVNFAAGKTAAAELVNFKNGYTIIKEHGSKVGEGFRGTAAHPTEAGLYTQTEKVESLTQSRTGIEPTNAAPVMDPDADHQPVNWKVFQHFPAEEPKEGIFA